MEAAKRVPTSKKNNNIRPPPCSRRRRAAHLGPRIDSTPATTTRRRKGRGSSSSSNNEKNGAYIIYNQDSVDLCTLLESFLRRTTTTTTVGVSVCPSLPPSARTTHHEHVYAPLWVEETRWGEGPSSREEPREMKTENGRRSFWKMSQSNRRSS